MRIHIKPGNIQRYNAAFYDDTCIECLTPIEEGDPLGFLTESDGRYGPLCDDCLINVGTPTEIETRKR